MATRTEAWTVAAAKARLSEVIDRALADGPRTITRNGRRAVVIVASEEWERKTKRKGNLAEFFSECLRPEGRDSMRNAGCPTRKPVGVVTSRDAGVASCATARPGVCNRAT